ncbi:hypothetical protein TNCV_4032371 [Trichonephila clavipes]|nr:hypothetical protein TNCV_4032371 [Trichonephila clavipes]
MVSVKKFIGPVSTSYPYCAWKSGSVAGWSHVLRVKLSLYHHFLTQLWCAYSLIVWKNGHCIYESFGSDLGQRGGVEILSNCPRVADVYVKWLTWLDDWEMHRDDNVPWCMVGLQPWKRALEKHVKRSHEKTLAHGMPSDVTLLDHI